MRSSCVLEEDSPMDNLGQAIEDTMKLLLILAILFIVVAGFGGFCIGRLVH